MKSEVSPGAYDVLPQQLSERNTTFVELRWIKILDGNNFKKSPNQLDVIFLGKLQSVKFDVAKSRKFQRVRVNLSVEYCCLIVTSSISSHKFQFLG